TGPYGACFFYLLATGQSDNLAPAGENALVSAESRIHTLFFVVEYWLLILYVIHLRIPLLRFLFSGKPMNKPAKTPASAS
ncbi:hypothetical protein OQ620_17855, partial [Klebsiella pneumoniae]|nr:hypothetical protein [Klebsiella pneumoniae]